MISNAVWDDAFARAKRVADGAGLPLLDPLLTYGDDSPDRYWTLPLADASSDRMGFGEVQNEEEGSVELSLFIRKGSTATPDMLMLCGAMSAAFRKAGEHAWPSGLSYRGQHLSAPTLDEVGNWYVVFLTVAYSYQTRILQES
ncbi:MAG: hypothetical protein LKH33_06810 [Acetobacter sp.]|jgi:hypothetical protein|nr:hypothetical protein [Acetobacter sp.]MCH4060489.1 hypothetical protein [Acetobacter sp.]MCH4087429.1 hypothetical protein [Acetobacter sp.]MCI1293947.1 hypothetical protein [Acetobacter sp.]MCI1320459.1 hypothetical protein [Acetobacter sp.]